VDVVALAGLGHLPHHAVAEADGDLVDVGHYVVAFGGDGLQLVRLLVEQEDGEGLGTDEVDDDFLDDLDDFAEVESGVELVAGDVEVRQVVVLLFDLDVAVGEVFVLFLDGGEALVDAAVFFGQMGDLVAQLLHFFGGAGGLMLRLRRGEAIAQALVLTEQFFREFLPFVEQLEELLGFRFFAHELPRTRRGETNIAGQFADSSCRWQLAVGRRTGCCERSTANCQLFHPVHSFRMAVGMSCKGTTSSIAPVLIASPGMPKMMAVSADSAIVLPPRSFTFLIDSAPSSPMPVMITATIRLPHDSLAVAKRRSTDGA